ncbi:MAG: DUF3604 domain-containing protein [Rhodobacteraceae bacterium]|jgi:hypothetical protein|nr:DUF3604 domain-containing protein [Paracoccaceae bacterium]
MTPPAVPPARLAGGGQQCTPIPAPLDPADLGTARVEPAGPVEAGSWQSFTLTYTAGRYGIDDSGALRLAFRFAADQTPLQFSDPKAPGYATVTASNLAVLECRFERKGNVRPFDHTLSVKVVNGFMKPGDTITIVLGDRSAGSPGLRVQTFVEESFEFHVLVDPVATFTFQSLPVQPQVAVVPGPPARHLLGLPSMVAAGAPFALTLKAEDVWGNPSDRCGEVFALAADPPLAGLPDRVSIGRGATFRRIAGLVAAAPGAVEVTLCDGAGAVRARQRMVVEAAPALRPFWADFHAQSEETIGTGSVERYFDFCRNEAFLDVASHQGNDFQITAEFWGRLNAVTAARNEPGRFVTLPGYEWSGNTALGGDRNVFFTSEGRPIRRSSHALIPDRSDLATDCTTAAELFVALEAAGEDAICFAHCGGRYADLGQGHHVRLETAVEVHSSWGTFEWLLHDALQRGHRVGIVCNSDGHKGRPGAEYPGASQFGAIGGLTCLLMPELSREAVVAALRSRRHYGTTGGPNGRLHLDVAVHVPARLCDRDPALGGHRTTPVERLAMGDIAETDAAEARLEVRVTASCGVERIDLFNGLDHVATIRNHDGAGSRLRVLMSGAAYRGRFRQVVWDGTADVTGARILRAGAVNFFNPDRTLARPSPDRLAWKLVTTGNFAGFDLWLDDPGAARIALATPLVTAGVEVDGLAGQDRVLAADGVLPRRITLHRLPADPLTPDMAVERAVVLAAGRDNALYARVTLEDGTQAWSSPVYLIRG